MCISAPFVQMSRGANVKCLWIFRKAPPILPLSFQTSEGFLKKIRLMGVQKGSPSSNKWGGKNIFQKFFSKKADLGVQINTFCAMSERSFYYGEIIKTSKTRMGFLHKSRNRQTNIQQPLPKMQKEMQAKSQSDCCRLSELSIQKRCENQT